MFLSFYPQILQAHSNPSAPSLFVQPPKDSPDSPPKAKLAGVSLEPGASLWGSAKAETSSPQGQDDPCKILQLEKWLGSSTTHG